MSKASYFKGLQRLLGLLLAVEAVCFLQEYIWLMKLSALVQYAIKRARFHRYKCKTQRNPIFIFAKMNSIGTLHTLPLTLFCNQIENNHLDTFHADNKLHQRDLIPKPADVSLRTQITWILRQLWMNSNIWTKNTIIHYRIGPI